MIKSSKIFGFPTAMLSRCKLGKRFACAGHCFGWIRNSWLGDGTSPPCRLRNMSAVLTVSARHTFGISARVSMVRSIAFLMICPRSPCLLHRATSTGTSIKLNFAKNSWEIREHGWKRLSLCALTIVSGHRWFASVWRIWVKSATTRLTGDWVR